MIPSIDVLCYLKDLSGLPSDEYLIDLHTKYIKEYGEIHPLATQRVRVFFGYAEVACPNVNLHVPDVSCGEPPILTVQDGLLVFTFDQYLYDLLSIRNYTMSVDIDGSTFEVLGVVSDKTYTVPDYDVVSDGSVITVVLSINIGSKVCTFTYNHTTTADKPIPEVLETLPPEFTYTPENNPDDDGGGSNDGYTIRVSLLSDIRTDPLSYTLDEYYLPRFTLPIHFEYTEFAAWIGLDYTGTFDDIDFQIVGTNTVTDNYAVDDPEHFSYQDMVGTKPIVAHINPTQLSQLQAGMLDLGEIRSLYYVTQSNGIETYAVDDDNTIKRISSDIYTDQVNLPVLEVGVEYDAPILGAWRDVDGYPDAASTLMFSPYIGKIIFTGEAENYVDLTATDSKKGWYKYDKKSTEFTPIIERSNLDEL